MVDSDADWAYGDYQNDRLRELIRKQDAERYDREPDPEGRTNVHNLSDRIVNPAALGVTREYKEGLKIVPDSYSSSGLDDNDIRPPSLASASFDPDLYQDYRELLDRLEEGKFYEAYIAGEPTLTIQHLTWNFLLKEFVALYGPCPTAPGCPSTGPMAEQLSEYKQFRVEQLEGWLKNIQARGDRIFMKMDYEEEEKTPMRPEEVHRILDNCFTPEELASFDMNPVTNPYGADHYLIPRPELDPTCIHTVSSAAAAKESASGPEGEIQYQGIYSIKVDDDDSDQHVLCRQLTTLGMFDPKMNITGSYLIPDVRCQMLAERIQECLMRYPLGIHFSKFVRVFEEYIGYVPDLETFFLTRYSEMVQEEKDFFWIQIEREFPPVGPRHLNQEILFPAHVSEIYDDLLTIMSRIWRKYRLMVVLLSPLLSLTDIYWKKFERFLAETTDVDAQGVPTPVFHYSDWGFESHEAFVRFCLGKWKNKKFHILEPGTVVTGIPGKVLDRSIYFGEIETVGAPPRKPSVAPTVIRRAPVIPPRCSMDGSLVRRYSDGIRIGDVSLFSAGEFGSPHLFGVIHCQYYRPFLRFNLFLQKFYKEVDVTKFKVLPSRLECGKIVVVLHRKEWERATIVKPILRNTFLVYLIDWAVFAAVGYRQMRYMTKELMEFPATGVLCKLELSEEVDHYSTADRRWDGKASATFIELTLEKALELKFMASDKYLGQTIWTVRVRQFDDLSGKLCLIPDLNRQVFLGKCRSMTPGKVLNDGGVNLLRESTRNRILFTNFDPLKSLAEQFSDTPKSENLVEKQDIPETIPLARVHYHVLADPHRKIKVQRDFAVLADLDSCTEPEDASALLETETEDLAQNVDEQIDSYLSAPTRSTDPLLKPIPIYFESKLRDMKRGYRVPLNTNPNADNKVPSNENLLPSSG